MNNRLANIISIAFHPLLMASFLFLILVYFAPSVVSPIQEDSVNTLVIIIFILTFIIPASSVGVLRMTSSISSLSLQSRRERVLPFFFIALYYGVTTYLFEEKFPINSHLILIFTTITGLILIVTLITTFWKISAHSVGINGLLGFLVAIDIRFPDSQLLWPILSVVLISGFVMSSRLILNAHNLSQVLLGGVTGFIVCFSTLYMFS